MKINVPGLDKHATQPSIVFSHKDIAGLPIQYFYAISYLYKLEYSCHHMHHGALLLVDF